MTETTPLIRIDGTAYRESKAVHEGDCMGCAFFEMRYSKKCNNAVEEIAKAAFGGDCVDRDVIYEEVKDVA